MQNYYEMDHKIQVKKEFHFVDAESISRVLPVQENIDATEQNSYFDGNIKTEIKGSFETNFCSQNDTALFSKDPVSEIKNETFIFNKDYEVHTRTENEEETIIPDFCSQNEEECFSSTFGMELERCSEIYIKTEMKDEQQCTETNSTESTCMYDEIKDGTDGNIPSAESPRLCREAGDNNGNSPLLSAKASVENSSFSFAMTECESQEINVTKIRFLENHLHTEQSGKSSDGKIYSSALFIHKSEKSKTLNISDKRFAHSSSIKQNTLIHEGKKPHKCPICEKHFTRLSNLKSHNVVHASIHKCQICGKTFSRLSRLKWHFLTHEGRRPHKCEICEKRFSQLSHLKLHTLIHEGKKPHKCQICEKSFTRLSNLKSHNFIHEGKKPHKCKTCEKSFSRFSDLKSHNFIHEGKKPHKCQRCEKTFNRLSHLKLHNLIHEGKKPHKCIICEKGFIQLSDLKRHNLIHEGKKLHKCIICEKQFTRASSLKLHHLVHESKTS